jgi:hypothetical protein
MSLIHTVLFQFKADAKPDDMNAIRIQPDKAQGTAQSQLHTDYTILMNRQACARFLSLKENCMHPTTQPAYITSLKGGRENSPEGL